MRWSTWTHLLTRVTPTRRLAKCNMPFRVLKLLERLASPDGWFLRHWSTIWAKFFRWMWGLDGSWCALKLDTHGCIRMSHNTPWSVIRFLSDASSPRKLFSMNSSKVIQTQKYPNIKRRRGSTKSIAASTMYTWAGVVLICSLICVWFLGKS